MSSHVIANKHPDKKETFRLKKNQFGAVAKLEISLWKRSEDCEYSVDASICELYYTGQALRISSQLKPMLSVTQRLPPRLVASNMMILGEVFRLPSFCG